MNALPRLLSLCMVLLALMPLSRAAETKAEPAKTHALFMGVDIAVQREKRLHHVEGVAGSELKIRIGKKEFLVPTRNRPTDLKVNHGLKLSATSVTLAGLESGPSYTPANDPNLKFIRESGAAGGAAAVQDLAYGQMINASLSAGMSAATAAANAGGPGAAAAQAAADAAATQYADAQRQADAASGMAMSDRYNVGLAAHRRMNELDEANYDAMEVSFKVSSPVELDDPHMIILFRFQERDAKPGTEGLLIHAKTLEPIGPKPKYIRVREAGLPVGFKYLGCTVHIFNRGKEVATNVSPKRVDLTRAEAQQYLVIEHISANKGATVPAVAVPGSLPGSWRQQLSLDQLNRLCFAKIAQDGTLQGVYVDESCQQELEDDATRAALGEVFFTPALDNGKPVDGVARLSLGAI